MNSIWINEVVIPGDEFAGKMWGKSESFSPMFPDNPPCIPSLFRRGDTPFVSVLFIRA